MPSTKVRRERRFALFLKNKEVLKNFFLPYPLPRELELLNPIEREKRLELSKI